MIKPINPSEARKGDHIPDFVVDAFNQLIKEKFNGGTATIKQDDVIQRIIEKNTVGGLTRQKIFDCGWLNVENLYENYGWVVTYDKPAYNEDYPATFKFTERK
jgi:hypothetical protein